MEELHLSASEIPCKLADHNLRTHYFVPGNTYPSLFQLDDSDHYFLIAVQSLNPNCHLSLRYGRVRMYPSSISHNEPVAGGPLHLVIHPDPELFLYGAEHSPVPFVRPDVQKTEDEEHDSLAWGFRLTSCTKSTMCEWNWIQIQSDPSAGGAPLSPSLVGRF